MLILSGWFNWITSSNYQTGILSHQRLILTREETRTPYKRTQFFSLNLWNCFFHYDCPVSFFKGFDSQSWGLSYKGFIWHNGRSQKYTEPFYERNTIIGILLDLSAGTLTFFQNGVNLGVAFTGLEQVNRETSLHGVCGSTGCRVTCRYLKLRLELFVLCRSARLCFLWWALPPLKLSFSWVWEARESPPYRNSAYTSSHSPYHTVDTHTNYHYPHLCSVKYTHMHIYKQGMTCFWFM